MQAKKLSYLLLLAVLWGPSFLFIRVAVHEVPPITLVAGRLAAASTLLYALLRLRGGELPRSPRLWGHAAFLAFVGMAFPFVLVGWGELYVDSAVASILNATVPIFTLLVAHVWTRDDRLSPLKIGGVLMGVLGTCLLIAPSMAEGVDASMWGLIAITVASACYGVAGVHARVHMRGLPTLVAPTMQLVLGAAMLLPLACIVDRPWELPPPSATAWAAWSGLILLGTVAAFVVYFRMLELATASYIAMVTYLIPVIAIVLGVVVGGEQLRAETYLGAIAILLGVVAVHARPKQAADAETTAPHEEPG